MSKPISATAEEIVIEAYLSAIKGKVKYPKHFDNESRLEFLRVVAFFEHCDVFADAKTRGQIFEVLAREIYGVSQEEIDKAKAQIYGVSQEEINKAKAQIEAE